MMETPDGHTDPRCSFCGKSHREVTRVIAGPGVYICSECIALCNDIIHETPARKSFGLAAGPVPRPDQIAEPLEQYVIGQRRVKRTLSVAVHNHYKRILDRDRESSDDEDAVEIAKSNVLLIGPTGTGKTLLAQTLARYLDVPLVLADATTLTEVGYVGEDADHMIQQLFESADRSVERASKGIVYIDEIDKVARRSYHQTVSRDVSGEGVQQALLRIIEGKTTNVTVKGSRRLPNPETVQVDTADVLFICGGSFEGLEEIISRRIGRKRVGYGAEVTSPERHDSAILRRVTPADLEDFGLIPELIGRLPVVACLDDLDEDDLVDILVQPRNSLVKQYQKLARMDDVDLSFTEAALRCVARRSHDIGSGARGLRTILENAMLEIMYDLPDDERVAACEVDVPVIEGTGGPRLHYHEEPG